MATVSTTRAKSVTPTSASSQAASSVQVAAPSRREFLYYIWGASMALLLGEASAGLVWFMFPRFKEGEFGGTFSFKPEDLPSAEAAPSSVPSGRFHVTHAADGVRALYGVCTHLGCLPKWVPTNNRFECPCHGSKYQLSGKYIEGPAPRDLDRFIMTITYADNGEVLVTPPDGGGIDVDMDRPIASIGINTGTRIKSDPHG